MILAAKCLYKKIGSKCKFRSILPKIVQKWSQKKYSFDVILKNYFLTTDSLYYTSSLPTPRVGSTSTAWPTGSHWLWLLAHAPPIEGATAHAQSCQILFLKKFFVGRNFLIVSFMWVYYWLIIAVFYSVVGQEIAGRVVDNSLMGRLWWFGHVIV